MFDEKRRDGKKVNAHYERQIAAIENNHQIQILKKMDILDYMEHGIGCYTSKLFSSAEYGSLVLLTLGLPIIISFTAGPISGAFDWATRKEITQEQYFHCIQRLALIDTPFSRRLFMDKVRAEYSERFSCQPRSNSSLALVKVMGPYPTRWKGNMSIDEKWEELLNYMIDNVNTNNGKALFNIIYELADTFIFLYFRYWVFKRFLKTDHAAYIGDDASKLIGTKLIELQMEAKPGFKSPCLDMDTENSFQNNRP